MSKRYTLTDLLNKANEIHNSKYNYDLVTEYSSIFDYIMIKCPEHGYFIQPWNSHINSKSSCHKCSSKINADKRKLTVEDFLKRSEKIHGNKYVYTNLKFNNMHDYITVTCKDHGDFKIQIQNHLDKQQGCPQCYTFKKEEFIARSNKVHNNKYTYDKVIWKNTKHKVCITCPIHGDFYQYANLHLYGKNGCNNCRPLNDRSTKEEVLTNFYNVHGNTYDYSNIGDDVRRCSTVSIICKKHGEFKQTINCHLIGCGCQICKESKGEKYIRIFLNANNITFTSQKKFTSCYGKKYCYKLPFDFYLPQYNILIEYDGKLHYEPWNNKESSLLRLQDIKRNDNIKNIWCKENNIPLIRISYKDNINEKLQELKDRYLTPVGYSNSLTL